MSAFIVEDKTINRVVTFLATDREGDWLRRYIQEQLGIDLTTSMGRETLGKLMFSLNCDAVNQRYGDDQAKEFRPLNYAYRIEISCNRIMAFKAIQCWHYQCSEGDIDQSNLYQVMERVQGHLAEMIVTRLDAYDKLAWA
jgi:hypothetical protein